MRVYPVPVVPEKKEKPAPPPAQPVNVWRPLTTADGQVYYHNMLTNETSWTMPEQPVAQPTPPAVQPAVQQPAVVVAQPEPKPDIKTPPMVAPALLGHRRAKSAMPAVNEGGSRPGHVNVALLSPGHGGGGYHPPLYNGAQPLHIPRKNDPAFEKETESVAPSQPFPPVQPVAPTQPSPPQPEPSQPDTHPPIQSHPPAQPQPPAQYQAPTQSHPPAQPSQPEVCIRDDKGVQTHVCHIIGRARTARIQTAPG